MPTSNIPSQPSKLSPAFMGQAVLGGTLMGLANLVPGISGGTMLVAAGVYQRFIDAISELTRFKFRLPSIALLTAVVVSAAVAIVLLAGTIKALVVDHRWIMYSLFIGLTLGGLPVVWRMIHRPSKATWFGLLAGFLGMAALALAQAKGAQGGSGADIGFAMMVLAGISGAGAMILPGVSGGYLLLVLGAYIPVLAGIDACKDAVQAMDLPALIPPMLHVVIPVGIGVVIGVVAVSNLLRYCLHRFENATLGVLLGLLIGAVVGLWPFQQGVAPMPGTQFKGHEVVLLEVGGEWNGTPIIEAEGGVMLEGDQTLYPAGLALTRSGDETQLKPAAPEDFPTEFFKPTAIQIALALGILLLGFLATTLVARLSPSE
ncbi:MAG: DUF368 domain-containing protein [Verrucomicrobiota bacterium]